MADAAQLPTSGAARLYLQKKFGGFFREQESTPSSAVAAASIVNAHPDRLGLLVVNLGVNVVTLGLTGAVTSSAGFDIAPNGGGVSFDVDEDFTLVTRQLFATSPGGASQMYVLELIREISAPIPGGNP